VADVEWEWPSLAFTVAPRRAKRKGLAHPAWIADTVNGKICRLSAEGRHERREMSNDLLSCPREAGRIQEILVRSLAIGICPAMGTLLLVGCGEPDKTRLSSFFQAERPIEYAYIPGWAVTPQRPDIKSFPARRVVLLPGDSRREQLLLALDDPEIQSYDSPFMLPLPGVSYDTGCGVLLCNTVPEKPIAENCILRQDYPDGKPIVRMAIDNGGGIIVGVPGLRPQKYRCSSERCKVEGGLMWLLAESISRERNRGHY
jgi:hypothetical protein